MTTKTKAQLLDEIKALQKRLAELQAVKAEPHQKNNINNTQTLRESEERFQILFKNAPDAYYLSDMSGNFIDGNRAAEKITGFEREELIGSNFLKQGLLSVNQLPKAAKLLLRNKAGLPTGPDEFILNRKDGTKISVEIRTHLIQIRGEQVVLGIAHDINKRVEAEQEIEMLLDLSRRASAEASLNDLLFFIANQIVEVITPAETASVFLYEEKRKVIKVQAWAGFTDSEIEGLEFSIEDSQVGRVLHTKKPTLIKDVSKSPDFKPIDKPSPMEIRSQMAVPLLFGKRIIGIVFADNLTRTDAFSQKNLDLLESIGNQLAGVIENARLLDQVRESEDQYHSVVEDTPGLINRFTPDGTITFVNQEYCRFFGRKYDELIGMNIQSVIPEEDRESVMSNIASLTEESPIQISVNKNIKHNNEICWMRWTDRALFDNKGNINSIQSFGNDITEQVLAQEKLKISEERFRAFMENVPAFAYILNKDLQHIYGNPASIAADGYSSLDDYIGTSIRNSYPDEISDEIEANSKRVLDEGCVTHHEFTTAVPGGKSSTLLDIKFPIQLPDGDTQVGGLAIDITERVQAEKALRESEKKYRNLFNSMLNGFALHEMIYDDGGKPIDYRFIEINPAFEKITGLMGADIVGKTALEVLPGLEPIWIENYGKVALTGEPFLFEQYAQEFDKHFEVIAFSPKKNQFATVFSDVTERRTFTRELQQERDKAQKYLDVAEVMIVAINKEGEITLVNQKGASILGYKIEELMGKNWFNTCVHTADRVQTKKIFDEFIAGEVGFGDHFEQTVITRSGEERIIAWHNTILRDEKKHIIGTLASGEDITKRKMAEQALEESEERLRQIIENSTNMFYSHTTDHQIIYVSPQSKQILDYDPEEMKVKWTSLTSDNPINEKALVSTNKAIETGVAQPPYEIELIGKKGQRIWAEIREAPVVLDGKTIMMVGSLTDISLRIRSRNLINALNQASVGMGAAQTHQEIFNAVSEELKQLGISCMLFPLNKTQSKLTTEYLSFESKALKAAEKLVGIKHEDFSIPIDVVDLYQEVVREKRVVFGDETEKLMSQVLPKFPKKLFDRIIKTLHIQSSISVPLIVEDEVIGVFSLQSNNLTQDDVPAANAFADQLSSAWNKIGLLQNLRKTIEGTIHTIAATVEARDPYTAGHQTRVADLATAIASEMHLSKDQVEGIRMAGIIHDLGKINVPAEILSKPGVLNELEFQIIQIHPQVGFDLLKEIEFPWPIAEMVHQHHEKMDGSGYPQGLKGDEILLEARILAVADTVEAMSSHRPYRPALGIEKALGQIKKEKGTLFDPDVVDACLKVFEDGYNLPGDQNIQISD